MKPFTITFAAMSMIAASPVYAQSGEEAAAEVAREAADAQTRTITRPSGKMLPPAPPAIVIPPPQPTAKTQWPNEKPPRLIDYSALEMRPADYPAQSWVNDEDGLVGFTLSVDDTGAVSSCTITLSSGYPALDSKTCLIATERARFQPATDKDGEPTVSEFSDNMTWRKRAPEFPGTSTIHVAYVVDKNGETKNCDVIEISGDISDRMRRTFDKEPCPGMNRPARALYRDEEGNPISKRVELQVIVKTETVAE